MSQEHLPQKQEHLAARRRPYAPPSVTEVYVDPARDMLVACAPGKLPSSGTVQCNAVQFT